MKKSNFVKIISAFMACLVLFVSVPANAVDKIMGEAQEKDVAENTAPTSEINTEDNNQEIFIVEEDISKRGQFEKHYLCSDGTYISLTYPEAVHYLDSDMQWKDVDQTLAFDNEIGSYVSTTSNFSVSFANTASSTDMARIEQDGYSISWGVQANEKRTTVPVGQMLSQEQNIASSELDTVLSSSSDSVAKVEIQESSDSENISDRVLTEKSTFALPRVSSQIRYTDIFSGEQNVSLKYTVYHNKVEEDIIIYDRGNISSVSMNMDIGTLSPTVNEDGSVDLIDEQGEMQFRIGVPYMIDADYSVCNDIAVTADKAGTLCTITYTPNEEWFYSEERNFPILLDPAVTTNDYVTNIQDTYYEENTTAGHASEQYLFVSPNDNNGNRRQAVVRVNELPKIDASMPIVSATLTLTAEYSPFSTVNLKARYFDSAFEFSEYSYSLLNEDMYQYTAFASLNYGSTTVDFDFSPYIYEIYSDEAYNMEDDGFFYGDFVISYANSTDTTTCYPFFSMESTTPANRPVFTVKYGYSLPAGMLNGGIYSFVSRGNSSYLTVNGTNPSSNSNVYTIGSGSAATAQKFKLEYRASTGGYLLRSMSSSSGNGLVVSINHGSANIGTNMNVILSSATDALAQEWLIVPIDYDEFKIVPRANMSLSLTTYGYNQSGVSGTSVNSQGNVFVKASVDNNNYQKWYIYDSNNNEVLTDFRSVYETGNYFLANDFNGKYLHRTSNYANCMRGTLNNLGEATVKWQIVNLGDGYCTIQRSDTPHYYLAPTSNSSGSGLTIYNSLSETIPDNYKWSITYTTGGCLIRNKASGYYLSAVNSTANPSSVCMYALSSTGTAAYSRQLWRIVSEDDYVELGTGALFDDVAIDVGESILPPILDNLGGATWATYRDFDYTITSGGDYVSYDANTDKFTAIKRGADTDTDPIMVSVTAIHKTTGLTDMFDIKVNKNAIIVIPGILGSELYIGNDNPYFNFNTPIVSQDMLNNIAEIGGNMSSAEIVALVGGYLLIPPIQTITNLTATAFVNMFYDSIKFNDDGSSKYEVYTKKYVYVEPTYDADGNRIFTLPSGYDARYYTPHAGVGDAYFHLLNALYGNSSYLDQEYQNDDISSQYFIEFFSYDWRLSNAVSANNLNTFINECGYDKVILIAHSMGGLVASKYMAMGQEQLNKVKEVYMLSSPLEGAPEIINVWANEDFTFLTGGNYEGWISFGNALLSVMTLSANSIQKLLGNYASIYELFPTQNYLSISTTPYLTHSTGSSSETVCQTYAASMAILSEWLPHFNSNLMSNAESFHVSCRVNNRHITYETDSYYFCSDHTTRGTTIQLKCSESLISKNIEVKLTTTNGDSLVPQWSATVGRTGNNVFEYDGGHMHVLSGKNPLEDMLDKLK